MTLGRFSLDYSKVIRSKLAEGGTIEQALADLRTAGASMFDCIVSIRSLYACSIQEAKEIVSSSAAWHDVVVATEVDFREFAADDDAKT